MSYSFEYIDIILLAMIAGFIFLRLRGILGKKTGYEDEMASSFPHDFSKEPLQKNKANMEFNEEAKNNFIKGAKIAYENIVVSFSSGNLSGVKQILSKKVYDQFENAIKDRKSNGQISETTFIGINSAEIKKHENNKGFLEVTVDFASEIISCIKDKDNKIISGDPKKVKKVYDTWIFSKEMSSNNPNWHLIGTESWLTKISDKDKKDWDSFINSNYKLEDKDGTSKKNKQTKYYISIDLHGYTLEQANKKVNELILDCYEKGIRNINIITGKGNRSNNQKDPYQSKDLSILKYAVPDYITNNSDLMDKILKIDQETVNEASSGSFNILLKKKQL